MGIHFVTLPFQHPCILQGEVALCHLPLSDDSSHLQVPFSGLKHWLAKTAPVSNQHISTRMKCTPIKDRLHLPNAHEKGKNAWYKAKCNILSISHPIGSFPTEQNEKQDTDNSKYV